MKPERRSGIVQDGENQKARRGAEGKKQPSENQSGQVVKDAVCIFMVQLFSGQSCVSLVT